MRGLTGTYLLHQVVHHAGPNHLNLHLQVRLEHRTRVSFVSSNSAVRNITGKPEALQAFKCLGIAFEHLSEFVGNNPGVQVHLQSVHHAHTVNMPSGLPNVLSDVKPGSLTGQVQVVVCIGVQPAEAHLLLDIATQYCVQAASHVRSTDSYGTLFKPRLLAHTAQYSGHTKFFQSQGRIGELIQSGVLEHGGVSHVTSGTQQVRHLSGISRCSTQDKVDGVVNGLLPLAGIGQRVLGLVNHCL